MNRKSILMTLPFLAILSSCKNEDKSKNDAQEKSYPLYSVIERDTVLDIPYVADIQANKNVEVHSRTEGLLEKIYIKEGQKVQQGQVLFKINDSELKIELSKAIASYNSAQADAKVALVEVERVQLLVDKKVITKTELDLAKAKYNAALAKAEVALSEKNAVSKRISYTTIHSPFTGIVDRIPMKEGSLVGPNTLLTTLSDIHTVYAYFNISENEYLQLAEDESSKFQLNSIKLVLPTGASYPFTGKLSYAESEIDESTGNIAYKVQFENPEGILRHGASGKILVTQTIAKAILVPQKAVFEIQDKYYVFIVDNNNIAKMQGIDVAQRLANNYVVVGGLKANDKIILEGIQTIKDGQKIKPRSK